MKRSEVVSTLGNPIDERIAAEMTPKELRASAYYVEHGMSQAEVAKRMHVSTVRVSQLISSACARASGEQGVSPERTMDGAEIEGLQEHIIAQA